MTAKAPGSYAGSMDSSGLEEQAALVALLRSRPGKLSWPELTTEVLEAGSAVDVWDRLVPTALIADPEEITPQTAASEIRRWDAEGCRLVSILDPEYPAENRGLQEEIAARGLVLSQFWPDAPPQKQNFLMRNATMSGYGLATVVVEAGEHSGARTQARLAVEHGRQVILTDQVVVRNQWAQALLGRPGVHLCSSVNSVLDVVEQLLAVWDELQRLVVS